MSENKDIVTIGGKALGANVLGALCVESFLSENYRFRRNQLNGKVEFAIISVNADGEPTEEESRLDFRPLTQEDRLRFASFVATTNNPHPLQDATGSRRFICLSIPNGKMIDNEGDIDYEQLYAQVLHELKELKAPYWFNNEEVVRIQQLNQGYMMQKDLAEMVLLCFRQPKEGEKVKSLNTTEMLNIIRKEYPSVSIDMKTKAYLGRILKDLNYERRSHSNLSYYMAVPLKAA